MYTQRPAEFDYHRPTSLDEAIGLLAKDGDTRPLAGGHSLLPMMKLRLAEPSMVVDIGRIPGLDGIEADGDELWIGALATHASVAASELVREKCRVLATTAEGIGDRQVRNRGTIGGSLAHADPGADYPTVVTALGATVVVRGPNGELEIAADGFFTGVFTTALAQGELVTAVRVPSVQKAAYVKHRHPASGYAVVGVACVVGTDEARVVVGGVTGAGPGWWYETKPSTGQFVETPSQASAESHSPLDGRQIVPVLPAGCAQIPAWQTSEVH